jgi:hypothetical protein
VLAGQALHHLSHAPSPVLFALIIFLPRSHIYAPNDLDHDLPIYASHVAGITAVYHRAQLLLVEMWSPKHFAYAVL